MIAQTTVDDVKRVLEAYRMEHFPDGKWASAMFDTGIDGEPETLVAVATETPLDSSVELRAPSLSVPERSSPVPIA